MLSLGDTVNMLGTQTIKGMWNLVPQWGMFVISVKFCGRIQLVPGEVNKCAELRRVFHPI